MSATSVLSHTFIKVILYVSIIAFLGIGAFIIWLFFQKKEMVTVTIPLGISPISYYDSHKISAVDTDIPIKCSVNNCTLFFVAPTDVDADLVQERCERLQGYRVPGAGYKSGSADDQMEPGYGTALPDSETCFAACEADRECMQYTFDSALKKCYKMSKKYPYTAVDKVDGWESGVCS